MPRSKQFLLEQIARARRFAQAMNTDADRERFEKLAADYQRELDAAEAADGQAPAVPTASGGAPATDDAAAAQPGLAVRMRPRRHPFRQMSRSRRRISPRSGSQARELAQCPDGGPNFRALHPIDVQIETKIQRWNFAMLNDGAYTVWFKTPRGEGTGIVHFENGKISGGDSIMTYGGFHEVFRFTATVTTTRHTAGHATVFGIDVLVLKLDGVSKGAIAKCTGTADVARLTFTLIRCRSDSSNARPDLPPAKFDPARLLKLTERSRVR